MPTKLTFREAVDKFWELYDRAKDEPTPAQLAKAIGSTENEAAILMVLIYMRPTSRRMVSR